MRREKDISIPIALRVLVGSGAAMLLAELTRSIGHPVTDGLAMFVGACGMTGAVLGVAGIVAHAGAWARKRALHSRAAARPAPKQLASTSTAPEGASVPVRAIEATADHNVSAVTATSTPRTRQR